MVRHLSRCALTLDRTQLNHAVLLVMDIDSPEAPGMALCERLMSGLDIPFIVLLPKADPDLAAEVLDLGAYDCVARPFNPQELYLRIRAILMRIGTMHIALEAQSDGAERQIGDEGVSLVAKTRQTGLSHPTRGPRRITSYFFILGLLIALSVLVVSLGQGAGVTTSEPLSDDENFGQIVVPLVEPFQQDPTNEVQVHYNLAVSYMRQDTPDTEAAAKEWETVIRLAPGSGQAQAAEEQLRSRGRR